MRTTRLILVGALASTGALGACSSNPTSKAATTTASVANQPVVNNTGVPSPAAAPDAGVAPAPTPAGPATAAPGAVNPNAPEVHEVGDIPDNQIFAPYTPTTGLYTISFPEGWSRSANGDAVSFTDKLNAIELAVGSKATAPTVETVTATDLRTIASKTSKFTPGAVSKVSRKGGDAILAKYEIDSAPNSVTGKVIRVSVERYEFWKNGKSAVITLIGAVGADNIDPWTKVTNSFAWSK